MRVTRIYTGADGDSHFEDLEVPVGGAGAAGDLSERFAVDGVIFRRTPADWRLDLHPAPRRQFVVTLSGRVEVSCGDGTSRQFGPGDIMLAEDTTGSGHRSTELDGVRRSLFLPLAIDETLRGWRQANP